MVNDGGTIAYDSDSHFVQTVRPDMAAEIDTPHDCIQELIAAGDMVGLRKFLDGLVEGEIRDRVAAALVRMLAMIIDAKNPRIKADALAAAAGLFLREGVTHAELARRHGVTRAAFNKEVQKMADEFRLPYRVSEHDLAVSRSCRCFNHRNLAHA
jgi:hypothetical protein